VVQTYIVLINAHGPALCAMRQQERCAEWRLPHTILVPDTMSIRRTLNPRAIASKLRFVAPTGDRDL